MSRAYYNEIDPKAVAWLEALMSEGLIAPGDVDNRSIEDVQAKDLKGYTQVHLFAGIGVWSAAFRFAGIPDSRPFWSASCPCQDFSVAGKRQGINGERDLWPDTLRLIQECRPDRVFGEQVESSISYGWLDRLSADLEEASYTPGSAVLGAHSAGAPHIRQRLWWVAHSRHATGYAQHEQQLQECIRRSGEPSAGSGMGDSQTREGHGRGSRDMGEAQRQGRCQHDASDYPSADGRMGDPQDPDRGARERGEEAGAGPDGQRGIRSPGPSASSGMADRQGGGRIQPSDGEGPDGQSPEPSEAQRLTAGERWQKVSWAGDCIGYDPETGELGDECSICGLDYGNECECPGPTHDGYEYELFGGTLYARRMANVQPERLQGSTPESADPRDDESQTGRDGDVCRLADSEHDEQRVRRGTGCQGEEGNEPGIEPSGCGETCGMADSERERGCGGERRVEHEGDALPHSFNLWQRGQWHNCRDGKTRWIPLEPWLFPLADVRATKGFRVAALRGAGNAINVATAAMWIRACMDVLDGQ